MLFLTPTETKGVFYDKGHPQVSYAIKPVFPPVGAEGNTAVAHFPPDDISLIHLFSHGWWSFVYPSPYFASLGVFTSISHPLFLLVTLFLRHASIRVNKSFTINTIMDTIKRISIREHNHNHRFGSSFLRDSIFIVHQPIEAVIDGDERSGNVDNDKGED